LIYGTNAICFCPLVTILNPFTLLLFVKKTECFVLLSWVLVLCLLSII
jgi:hypothetical protein